MRALEPRPFADLAISFERALRNLARGSHDGALGAPLEGCPSW